MTSALWQVEIGAGLAKVTQIKLSLVGGAAPTVFNAIGQLGAEHRAKLLYLADGKGNIYLVDPAKTTGNTVKMSFVAAPAPVVAIADHPDQTVGTIFATSTALYNSS